MSELSERLWARREEIEEAAWTRICAVADPREVGDPAYVQGLGTAVSAALEYGLQGLRASEEHLPPVPVALIAQARLAARNRIGIDTVFRRYLAGYTLLGDFLAHEAAELELPSAALETLVHIQAAALERLLAAVSEEHALEARSSASRPQQHRLRLVERLLAGEPADASELRYPFEASHLGLVAAGPGAEALVRDLACASGRLVLAIHPAKDTVWAWLAGRRPLDSSEVLEIASAKATEGAAIAIGEPAPGLPGWRLTHRQAAAAAPIARRGAHPAVRYVDVALLAAALGDELLAASLRRSYLQPLGCERDGGRACRETLRAYLRSEGNVSAAAAALHASRNTVGSRLHAAEQAIGRPLAECSAELEVALDLESLATP